VSDITEKPTAEFLEVLAAAVRQMTTPVLLGAREAVVREGRDHPDSLAVIDRELERQQS